MTSFPNRNPEMHIDGRDALFAFASNVVGMEMAKGLNTSAYLGDFGSYQLSNMLSGGVSAAMGDKWFGMDAPHDWGMYAFERGIGGMKSYSEMRLGNYAGDISADSSLSFFKIGRAHV